MRYTTLHGVTATDSPVTLVCDNRSALKYAAPPTHTASAIQTNHADYDICVYIHETIKSLPFQIKLEWVKSHTDDGKPFEKLTRPEQLNVIADSLAGDLQQNLPPLAHSRQTLTACCTAMRHW
jgi:hypothetical protein